MKRIYIFLAIIMLSGATTFAQNIELSNNLIQRYEVAQEKALSKNATTHDHLWVTPLLNEAVKNWDNLTDNAKKIFRDYRNRPTFTGTELTSELGNFRFHYTTDGGAGEAVDATDVNPSNGTPDYIDNMAGKFVNDVYANYHVTRSLTVPPNDGTIGGNSLYDVYVSGDVAGAGTYGYAAPETNVVDNPNSTGLTEVDAYTSYMVMRNNYVGFGDQNIALSVTTAHEYMHAIQMGYAQSMDSWFMEASATWSEDYIFPGYDDNLQYLMSVYGSTDVAINLKNAEAGGTFDGHWYGAWIFIKYMTEHTGNGIIKNIYERCIQYYAVDAIDVELTANWNSSLDGTFVNFVIANVILESNAGFSPYTYARASVYLNYVNNNGGFTYENGNTALNYTGSNINWSSQTNGNNRLMRLSADYFTLTATQNFKISMNESAGTGLMLIKKNNTSGNIFIAASNSNGEINVTDAASWDIFIPIVIRTEENVTDTNPYNYTLSVTNATTGVGNLENKISIFPNPAQNYINVKGFDEGQLRINLTDVLGRQVISQKLSKDKKINVENLENGIYFLNIMKNNQIIKTEKLIISN